MLPFFGRRCRRFAAPFTGVGATFYTTAKGKCFSILGRWSRHHVAHFIAVGAAFYATAMVNGALFSYVGVGVMLPILVLLVPPFTLQRG